jgi:hypothetical protein
MWILSWDSVRFFALSICLAALAAVLASCGGEDEPPAQAWADDVCTRINTWGQELRDIATGGSVAEIQQALDQAVTATDDLVTDLQEIGPPETESGAEAKAAVDELAGSTKERVDRVRAEAEDAEGSSDLLQLAASVATELDAAQQEARATFDQVSDLDPSGELREGIESSEACDELRAAVGQGE